ncbi:hypothetical protein [Niallia taxi]|uniref:hypothetical protein n=1 Tax=Niallia taxi TaxID=2499688 RepID=UPI0015F47874|nr:hypothetical protein [Niallia taxi]
MIPVYESFSNKVIITWEEQIEGRTKPISHYFPDRNDTKPALVQLHPIDKERVVRSVFPGPMPGWIEEYCKHHPFKAGEVEYEGKKSWWIANWDSYSSNMKPLVSPTLEGALKAFSREIPDCYSHVREKLLEGIYTAVTNFQQDAKAFEPFLYWREEELQGSEGVLVIGDYQGLFMDWNDFEDDYEYRRALDFSGNLTNLVDSLVTPLPLKIEDEIELEDELLELDETVESVDDEEQASIENMELDLDDETIALDGQSEEDMDEIWSLDDIDSLLDIEEEVIDLDDIDSMADLDDLLPEIEEDEYIEEEPQDFSTDEETDLEFSDEEGVDESISEIDSLTLVEEELEIEEFDSTELSDELEDSTYDEELPDADELELELSDDELSFEEEIVVEDELEVELTDNTDELTDVEELPAVDSEEEVSLNEEPVEEDIELDAVEEEPIQEVAEPVKEEPKTATKADSTDSIKIVEVDTANKKKKVSEGQFMLDLF